MDTKNFSDKYIKINSPIINAFFTNVLAKGAYDFETIFYSERLNISKLELSLVNLMEGFENIFENSMLANSSMTVDFTEVYEFGFVEDSLPFKNHSNKLVRNITTFYNVWLNEKNVTTITNMTVTSYINNCLDSKCPEYVFILFLILLQSCLIQVNCSYKFKLETKIKKLFDEIIKFKDLLAIGKRTLDFDLEDFINKQSKLFTRAILISNNNF